jgi:hypothetical protein
MLQSTLLPITPILSLSSVVGGKVEHAHGSYNMGLMRTAIGWAGIFRNCTRNARHLLGLSAMPEGQYQNVLYFVRFDEAWKVRQLSRINSQDIIHDVRMSEHGLIGCWRKSEGEYYPVKCHLSEDLTLTAFPISKLPGKNWNYLPDRWLDMAWVDEVGLMRTFQGPKGYADQIVTREGPHLRGSAPYARLDGRLLTTYHTVEQDHEKRRTYWHYFALLEEEPPYRIERLSAPFKFGHGGEPGRIQFLMALLPDGPEHFIISLGVADADNLVARIEANDVRGLLV